jgi:hypothetical protein
MYEILNEPTITNFIFEDWNDHMGRDWDEWMAYATKTIDMIRQNDPEAVVLVGPPGWCTTILGPRDWDKEGFKSDYGFIQRPNVAYAIHVYPHTTIGFVPRDPSNEFINWEYGCGQYSDEIPIFISEVGYSSFKHPEIADACEDAYIGPGRYREDIMSYLESKNLGWSVFTFDEDYYHEAFGEGENYVPGHVADWSMIQDANFTPSDAGEFFRSHSLPPAPKGKITISIRDSEGNILSDAKWQLDGHEQTTNQADLVTGATYTVSGSQIEGYKQPENFQVKLTKQGETKEITLIYSKNENESQSVSMVTHVSATFLKEGKAVYDDATFQQISFGFEYPRDEIETDKSHVGTLTIKNGEYSYWDADGNRQNVTPSDPSPEFPLRWDSSGPDYTDFAPRWENGEWIAFQRSANNGLRGKEFTWTLYGESYTETVPNFSATQEQIETYVPSVTLKDNAVDMSVTNKTGGTVSVPLDNRCRIDIFDQNNNRIARSDWQDFKAGDRPAYSFPFPLGTQKQDVKRVQVDFRPTVGENRIRYRWNFFSADKENAGISGLPSDLSLEVGEELSIPVVLTGGYWLDRNTLYPVFSTDPSVVTVDYDSNGQNVTLLLKGIRAGNAELSVVYRDSASFYYTTPIQVVVTNVSATDPTGPETGRSSGGGGCNTGYGMIGLLFLGVAVQISYLIKSSCY